MASYLNENVNFISPIAELNGKDCVCNAARNFSEILKDIDIISRFENEDQVVLVYDMTVSEPIRKFRAAVLMDFSHDLISKIQLFYDATSFNQKREEIFGKQFI